MLCSALSGTAQAALAHADWKTAGDSAITVDSNTGFEWLKLNQTTGKSINDVVSQMGVGGLYHGWRLPTDREVEALVSQMMSPLVFNENDTVYGGSGYRGYTTTWRSWMSTTRAVTSGPSGNNNRYWYSYGLYRGDTGNVEMSGTYYRIKDSFGDRTYYANIYDDYYDAGYSNSYANVSYGVFLVADGGMTLGGGDQNVEDGGTGGSGGTGGQTPAPADVPVQGIGAIELSLILTPLFSRKKNVGCFKITNGCSEMHTEKANTMLAFLFQYR